LAFSLFIAAVVLVLGKALGLIPPVVTGMWIGEVEYWWVVGEIVVSFLFLGRVSGISERRSAGIYVKVEYGIRKEK